MTARFLLIVMLGLAGLTGSQAQDRKPTGQEVAAVRDCAAKYSDDLDKAEQRCLFNFVAKPCLKKSAGHGGDQASAECYRVEGLIWDDLLNDNYKSLLGTLDDDQTTKLRAMQRAWIASRDATCQFYDDKIRGSMAAMMDAACVTRETARRALLLKFFEGL